MNKSKLSGFIMKKNAENVKNVSVFEIIDRNSSAIFN